MEIAVEAEKVLTDLVKHVEDGDAVVFTRDGVRVAKLVAVSQKTTTPGERRALIQRIRSRAPSDKGNEPYDAFLYDEDGLPG